MVPAIQESELMPQRLIGKGDGAAGAHPFHLRRAQILGLIIKDLPTDSADEVVLSTAHLPMIRETMTIRSKAYLRQIEKKITE